MRISDWSSDVCSSDLPHEQEVAHLHLGGRDLEGLAITDDDGHGRGQVQERPDRLVGAAARTHLEPMAEKHERGEDRYGLVADLATPCRSEERRVGEEGVQPGRSRVWPYHKKKK